MCTCASGIHLPAALEVCILATCVFWSAAVRGSGSFSVVGVPSATKSWVWAGDCMRGSISTQYRYERNTVHECHLGMLHYMPTESGNGVVAVSSADESTDPVCTSCMCARSTSMSQASSNDDYLTCIHASSAGKMSTKFGTWAAVSSTSESDELVSTF